MISRIQEAISDVEMWGSGSHEYIIILAPLNTLENLFQEDLLNDCPVGGQDLAQNPDPTDGLPKFNGHLFIEDASLTQIVICSLVSHRRAVVQM